jgi:hypothetical protein
MTWVERLRFFVACLVLRVFTGYRVSWDEASGTLRVMHPTKTMREIAFDLQRVTERWRL